MRSRLALAVVALLGAALLTGPAAAHPQGGIATGFAHGFAHPWSGLDHLLAMLAVGLWAGSLGGRAMLLVPGSFVVFMLVGAGFGMAGVAWPLVEPTIAVSVLLFGLLVASRTRLPLAAGMAITGLFALAHGHAHGTEILPGEGGMLFMAGFALATTLIHGLGLALSLGTARLRPAAAALPLGASIASAGAILLAAQF